VKVTDVDARTLHVIAKVAELGGSATAWNQDTFVLAWTQTVHDGELADSRARATELANAILVLSTATPFSVDALAGLVRGLLAEPRWEHFVASFSLVRREGDAWRAYGCGATGVASLRPGRIEAVVPPQTLKRRFGPDVEIPAHFDHVIADAATGTLQASGIDQAEVADGCEWLVATDDPAHYERILVEWVHSGAWPEKLVVELLERARAGLKNPAYHERASWIAARLPPGR
jgi:hypothetical protein